jgi:hypothetical protein
VKILFARVDGDEGYGISFKQHFAQFKSRLRSDLSVEKSVFEVLTSVSPFCIGNWLHLLKNARIGLFSEKICVNPLVRSVGTSKTSLCEHFEKSSTFADASSPGKMRNAYPFNLSHDPARFICANEKRLVTYFCMPL